jgi:hypothetical protein
MWRGTCNPLKIILKFWQPWSKSMWEMGRTWGFRLYMTGRDPGTEFTIQQMEEIREDVPIGPNAYNPTRFLLVHLPLEAQK